MTTSSATQSSATRLSGRTVGMIALAVAGLTDIANAVLTFIVGDDGDRPPSAVLMVLIVAGVVSFAGFAGRRGLSAAYLARVLSALAGIPAFFLDAPVWVDVLVGIGLVLSVAGIWLTLPALRRSAAVRP